MKTLILEKMQKELKQFMKKVKELEKENHIQKEKLNRSIFQQESLQERLTQEVQQQQKPFEDTQNKDVFKIVVSNGVMVQLRDNSHYVDTEKQDCVAEEKNKKPVDHYIHVKELLRKHENEKAERKNTIRKLQEELEDSRREKTMILQLGLLLYQKILDMEQLQKELDYTTNKA
ncbi:ankyrin repeat domain-containing protein 26-like isoform X2 [Antechinus flavipes]|uniref:ankyrin repeat domain-containing protein 26-like isoform X2 n=1 Tax=Antechinus flavipes TaxID=38775 RepID=UPI002235F3B2|nr:ankyrin repeat domain-containing protein 26-like isoform X2 [Antechinus flavipes]